MSPRVMSRKALELGQGVFNHVERCQSVERLRYSGNGAKWLKLQKF